MFLGSTFSRGRGWRLGVGGGGCDDQRVARETGGPGGERLSALRLLNELVLLHPPAPPVRSLQSVDKAIMNLLGAGGSGHATLTKVPRPKCARLIVQLYTVVYMSEAPVVML